MSVASATGTATTAVVRVTDLLLERPRTVLATLASAQILATLVLALSVPHNGWVYFQGGDQTWFSTTGWLLGQLQLPPTEVSYLWPLVQAPITWVTGSTYVQELPVLLVLNVLVFGPIGLLCIYGIAVQIGGRLLGYWAALLSVIAPYAVIPLWVERYHEKWTEQFLPQATGLTAMADFPSMVIVLAAALFITRSLAPGRLADAAMAGFLLGAAGGLKPPNLLMGFGAALAYPLARRWREAAVFGAAVIPSLLLLAFWKERGLGALPVFAVEQIRVAAGATPIALDVNVHKYLQPDVHHWRTQMAQLREFFLAPRVAQWAPFAGLLALLRVRRAAMAGLLAGWLGAFILVKGFNESADIQANTFWRLLMPAWPAYLLLVSSIPLLIPNLARSLGSRLAPPMEKPLRPRWVVVAFALMVALPAGAAAASSRISPPTPAIVQNGLLTPIDTSVVLTTKKVGEAQHLTWTDQKRRANVFYRIYRSTKPDGDLACVTSNSVSWYCYLYDDPIATTRGRSFVDRDSPRGATYRIGVGTNWVNDPALGDVFAVSSAVRAAG